MHFTTTLFATLLIITSILLPRTTAAGTYYVRPDNSSMLDCPEGNGCLIFDHYVQATATYFTSRSRFIFLRGYHTVQNKLFLRRVSDLMLLGETNVPATNIQIRISQCIYFSHVSNINLRGLTFILNNYERCDSSLNVESSTRVTISSMIFLGSGDINKLARALAFNGSQITIQNCQFKGNTGMEGGAIVSLNADRGNLLLQSNTFEGNIAITSGGAIYAEGGFSYTSFALTLARNNEFWNNSAGNGASIGNGGAIFCLGCNVTLQGNVKFHDNHCNDQEGGAVYFNFVKLITHSKSNVSFSYNSPGAICVIFHSIMVVKGELKLSNNMGSALHVLFQSNVTFEGRTTMKDNVGNSGGAMQIRHNSAVSFNSKYTVFLNNSAFIAGGAIYSENGGITFESRGFTGFYNNHAEASGGAFYVSKTQIISNPFSIVDVKFNTARNGGAIYMRTGAIMILQQKINFLISQNHATEFGGGIFHEDLASKSQCSINKVNSTNEKILPHCFMQYGIESHRLLINNTADKGGDLLYGGLLDKCSLLTGYSISRFSLEDFVEGNMSMKAKIEKVSSEPYKLCFCENSTNFDCTGDRIISVYRGQQITISLIALGQFDLPVSTHVRAVLSNSSRLDLRQNSQRTSQWCSNFTYNIYSTRNNERVVLYSDGLCHDNGLAEATVHAAFLLCPDGFLLLGEQCICEQRLQKHAICIIAEKPLILKKMGLTLWMNATYNASGYAGLILYEKCPIHNCRTVEINITLGYPDIQCAYNHSGVLCGMCADGNSVLLGSSKCEKCSNIYLALILPFALAGIILTVFLISFRLTVSTGMINSVILYANIVQVNRRVFFPTQSINVLTVFIAWMNLDLGFETCFFDGLNEYILTWLQFIFPIYVWIIISLVILTSRYSITVSKFIGSDPIAVLATLLLMSYTKLLKIIVEVYSFVELNYPGGRKVTVWLKDANVPYLKSGHLILTVATSLLLIVVFLPYTFLLLLGHKTYKFLGGKNMYRIGRIKPFLESYYAPYRNKTRYWTGFLLLVRCILYVVFSYNSLGGENWSLWAINISFTGISLCLSVRIYKDLSVNILEVSIYLNLIILSAITLAGINTTALVYVLVGTVFTQMLGIIAYHFHLLYIAKFPVWKKITAFLKKYSNKTKEEPLSTNVSSQEQPKVITTTLINLREPLLEN